MGTLVFTNELFRLNIEIQQALDAWGLNFFQDI
jgi:cytochrome c-type biogenesis protein